MTARIIKDPGDGGAYAPAGAWVFGYGDEFPSFFKPSGAIDTPPANVLFDRRDLGKLYRWSASRAAWVEQFIQQPTQFTSVFDFMTAAQITDVQASGTGDTTAPIQAAIDYVDNLGGGTVYIPKGTYRLSSTLLASRSSSFKTVNLVGAGSLATQLQWRGATNLPAIRVNGLKQYIFEGFLLENKVAVGTTQGVLVQRDTGTGTQSGSCVWRNVRVKGFATGMMLGNAAILQATSEYHFDHLALESNTVGCQIESGNSLDFVFTMLELGANGTGLNVASGGVVAVVGGSASGQTVADFNFAPGGSYSISTFRSEHANRFLTGAGTTAGTAIHVSGCSVTAIDNGDGFGIRMGSGGLPVVLIGNDLICKIALSGTSNASCVLIGNAIGHTEPVDFSILGGTGAHYVFLGNHQVDSGNISVGHFPDEVGYVAAGVKVPSFKLDTTGLVNTKASVAGGSGFRLPHGTAPTSPVDGDIWTTTAGLFVRVNGGTVGPLS